MRAVVVDPEAPNRYKDVELPDPTPAHAEVCLAMSAASLNFRDLIVRSNPVSPFFGDARGRIVLSDGVGRVCALGQGVQAHYLGKRVMPCFFPDWLCGKPTPATIKRHLGGSVNGVLAETIVVPASSLVVVPEHLSDTEAATLPCAGVTAWSALVAYGHAASGDTILIQGTGGVSIFALQIAKILGLRAIVTSSSDEKLERAKLLGADATINYRAIPDWASAARELTGGLGVDHLIDVGGEATLAQSLRAMALGGHLSLVGVLTGFGGQLDAMALRGRTGHIHTVEVESRAMLQQLADFTDKHQLRPVVDRIYELSQANQAVDHLAQGAHFSKLAIRISHSELHYRLG